VVSHGILPQIGRRGERLSYEKYICTSKKFGYALFDDRQTNRTKEPEGLARHIEPPHKEKSMSIATAHRGIDHRVAALPLDDDGFLIDHRSWDRDLAERLALHLGVGPLGATHWLVLEFMRDRYCRLGALPPMRNLCRKVGVDRAAVKQAFGNCRNAWAIAGLPNPGAEAVTYMA
jgi:tRNA 2-thiouridine synthesizing protein E